jgi:hypothetical protein
MRCLLQALPGNRGIEDLTVPNKHDRMSGDNWSHLCRSLSTHPRMARLALEYEFSTMANRLSSESKSTMMNAILQMLQHNTVVHTLALPNSFKNECFALIGNVHT